ncbi:MAG TPA: hypothetical protein VK395_16285 [Gemmataceae bacterium]|nr:hypothetical protein [Gemmataceae bacterium]
MSQIACRSNSFGVDIPEKMYYPECATATPGLALQRLRRNGRPDSGPTPMGRTLVYALHCKSTHGDLECATK